MSKQRTIINGDYLILPIDPDAPKTTVSIRNENGLLYDFKAHIEVQRPQLWMYLPVARFRGEEVLLSADPDTDLTLTFTDKVPAPTAAMAPERPHLHFSAPYGWLNDPNGLVFHDGLYHLFYQHNPVGVCWDNMFWGHAVSQDLIDWKDLGCAAFPDKWGICFSGCGFYDRRNDSGLGTTEQPPLLFYYTAAGSTSLLSQGQPFTQRLLYSLDGGMTLLPYEKNPILPHVVAENRDPKVVWCEELSSYVMVLYFDGNIFALYTSTDLLHWKELQRLSIPTDRECPALIRLPIEEEEDHRWVLMGACNRYLIGSFVGGLFRPEGEPLSYHANATPGVRTAYAAQSFDNTSDRQIRLLWQDLPTPHSCFRGQMTLPQEMSLRRVKGQLRLAAAPIGELKNYAEATETATFALAEAPYTRRLAPAAYDITLSLAEGSGDLQIALGENRFTVSQSKNLLRFPTAELPLRLTDAPIHLRILFDTCGLEIYADDGLLYATSYAVTSEQSPSLTLSAEAGAPKGEITLARLRSIDPSAR